ncbi:hypothetical protein ACFLS8_04000 [Chloroflexota bacterium]
MKKNKLALTLLAIVTLMFLFAATGCDLPRNLGLFIEVTNQTDAPIRFFVNGAIRSTVPTGETKKVGTMAIWIGANPPWCQGNEHLIEVKAEAGKEVYSEELTWQELGDIDWQLTITGG